MEIPLWQRVVAPLVYLLPWSDALQFAGPLFQQYPWMQWLTLPVLPLALLENSIPALLTDIILVVLGFAFTILLQPLGGSGLLIRTLSSTVVIATLAILVFALVECLQGHEPDLPGISQATRMQLY